MSERVGPYCTVCERLERENAELALSRDEALSNVKWREADVAKLRASNFNLRRACELWLAHANTKTFVYYSESSKSEVSQLVAQTKAALAPPTPKAPDGQESSCG